MSHLRAPVHNFVRWAGADGPVRMVGFPHANMEAYGCACLQMTPSKASIRVEPSGTQRGHWGRSMIPNQEAEGHVCSNGEFTDQQAASWFTCMTFDRTAAAQMPYRPTSPSSPPCSTPSVRPTFARSISIHDCAETGELLAYFWRVNTFV